MRAYKSGVPLQVLVTGAIILGMLALGASLLVQGYRGVESTLVAAAGEAAGQLGVTVNERIRRLLDPAQNTLRLLSYDNVSQLDNLPARLERLPMLAENLSANTTLSAVYIGYPNGEFLLIRALRTAKARQALKAPDKTLYLVQTQTLGEQGALVGEWRYYDAGLQLLRREERPDYRYDPRQRSWYKEAYAGRGTVLTQPYVFFTTQEIGLTLALRSVDGAAVIGMDASVDDLATEMGGLRQTAHTELAVLGGQNTVIAYPDLNRLLRHQDREVRLARLDELGVPALSRLAELGGPASTPQAYRVGDEDWYGIWVPLVHFASGQAKVLISIPADELLAGARQMLLRQALWSGALLLALLLLGWLVGRRIARPLRVLSDQVGALAAFDFARPVGVDSKIREVRELSRVLGGMSKTIHNFQGITLSLSRETRLDSMLADVLSRLVEATGVLGGAVYLLPEQDNRLVQACAVNGEHYPQSLLIEGFDEESLAGLLDQVLSGRGRHMEVSLRNRSEELLGILVLQLPEEGERRRRPRRPFKRFVEELSGAAAVAIETRQLIEAQQRLLDAIIKLLADAIDAKSPYTGGHCERVPQLADMLVQKAIDDRAGPYAGFSMSDAERYEFQIAAWLHDCGKITSPEYVVDKATKLETLYNRLHEVRMRFEVLWRDADIRYWQGCAGGGDEAQLRALRDAEQQALQEDFAFVAQANVGGEFMKDEDVARLQRIGERRWWRYFDDRLGISQDEAERLVSTPAGPLPVEERLLADKPSHQVPWGERRPPVAKDDPRNTWGFDMRLPPFASNYGELYNLGIRRGTLTEEERFKINEHIVQTLMMLSALPLPRNLRRVPTIAANHHEKMDGTGYPRRLSGADMSIPERVMAIADIFEALTAADRPYKAPKTLSESLKILAFMARDRHVDAGLFRLFVESGVYREYGERFLRPDQIDTVDEAALLAIVEAGAAEKA
ncbi:HD domain-containing phosphohydrolase [Pseudomonas citronellolis]|uniref:HD domain-containing phosphohydrolase n=1 Tax=Pseudomonas citronellolis TaxID=53408 RepID=UPI0023E3B876|nr:HD domain-containing phosphohydrolase [Pseudomonas citronellolis]MDF3933558.1 HD domain-containing phosphohydrolase [Pseudomonas citronellolis]